MNDQPAKPVDRLALVLAIAAFALINLAVVGHFTALVGALLVKVFLGLGFVSGLLAWIRLKKTG